MAGGNKTQSEMKRSFEDLFAEYADVIYRLCLFKTSNEDVAHDLTQETFLRLWRAMSGDQPVLKPKQYLYQIARNLIIDHYKKMKSVSLDQMMEEGFDTGEKDPKIGLQSELSLLRSAIEKLEEDYREVIYMRFVEDMGVGDIAEALDISANLVSVRLNRGKQKLEELFAGA